MSINISLPDGSVRSFDDEPVTPADVAASIGSGLRKAAIAATVNGSEVDLTTPLADGDKLALITVDSEPGRHVLRHSTAHVMAQAVTQLFPGAKFSIGPAIENGFYYDFELPNGQTFSDDDLAVIEERMRAIVKANQPFERSELSGDEALKVFADQPYKVEIIERVRQLDQQAADESGVDVSDEGEVAADGAISVYRNSDDFVDLCRGPHVPSTGRLGHFKLQKVAGAYWRGNEKGPMLQRIYGTAWESKQALAEYLERLVEAEKRDHRRLANELDLLSFPAEIGGGLAVWHPKGAIVRKIMEDYSRWRHEHGGYEFVYTPHLTKSQLFETSGHLDWYADGMYPPMEMDNGTYYMKPMNCPMHCLIFRSRQRSYKELPLRLFELGTVYRYERAGTLHGLMRIRGFTQDDSHIYCTPDQAAAEIASLLDFVLSVLRAFGFRDFTFNLSTKDPGKYVGSDAAWTDATAALQSALDRHGLAYSVKEGDAAFYGPKIDIDVRDAIGRTWQLSTIQYDFNHPERFQLEYVGADNNRHRPIMLHRALFGSIERFFGVLLEHYAGALPTWLSPVQVRVLPVASAHEEYADVVAARLRSAGMRTDVVHANDALGKRIRAAKLEKLPYVLVVGDDDVAEQTVGVNPRGGEVERGVPVDVFISRLVDELAAAESDAHGLTGTTPVLERLWNGWRASYVQSGGEVDGVPEGTGDEAGAGEPGDGSAGSVFTRILRSGLSDDEAHIVHRGACVFVICNRFPYSVGHLLVLPYREVGDLENLTADEATELWATARDAVVTLKAVYRPEGINVGVNLGKPAGGSVSEHLHVHVVPRWTGDVNFMTATANTRTLPEALDVTAARIRSAWP